MSLLQQPRPEPDDATPSHPATAVRSVAFDTSVRFVRAVQERPGGFVEFEFCVGDEQLAIELVMPRAAFEDFCLRNRVEHR